VGAWKVADRELYLEGEGRKGLGAKNRSLGKRGRDNSKRDLLGGTQTNPNSSRLSSEG